MRILAVVPPTTDQENQFYCIVGEGELHEEFHYKSFAEVPSLGRWLAVLTPEQMAWAAEAFGTRTRYYHELFYPDTKNLHFITGIKLGEYMWEAKWTDTNPGELISIFYSR